ERKALSLLEAGAQVRLISPQLTDTLHERAADVQGDWINKRHASAPFFLCLNVSKFFRHIHTGLF
ncbi:hypothetical protein VU06_04055, partial [Desulfobulbus sp. F3]|nr:hypothetical protein [Desulfobulbus sp. F3]